MMPNFQLHYNQGYAARPAPVIVAPTDSELAIHEEIARAKFHIERPPIRGLLRGGWQDPIDPIEQHFFWEAKFREDMKRFEQHQSRAYQNLLQSALGFEPTDHSDAPPYISTTPTSKPQPCVDFGFEPTEASE